LRAPVQVQRAPRGGSSPQQRATARGQDRDGAYEAMLSPPWDVQTADVERWVEHDTNDDGSEGREP
jgi:hypothetical protein